MIDPTAPNENTAVHQLQLCDSYGRCARLALAMAMQQSPREQIALFLEWGNVCDAPWAYRSAYADMLRRALREVPLRDVRRAEERAWLDSMGPVIRVYRGCEAGRLRGLSWTTDLDVARGFAVSRRTVNKRPTLVSALIPKDHVLALFLDRQEYEVVVDPRRLRQVTPLQRQAMASPPAHAIS